MGHTKCVQNVILVSQNAQFGSKWGLRIRTMTRAPVGERQNTLKRVGACFLCLSTAKGHVYRNCDAKCTKCQGRHHALLCGPTRNSVPNCDNATSTSNSRMCPNTVTPLSSPCVSHVSGNVSNVNSVSGKTTHVFLQTARVSVNVEWQMPLFCSMQVLIRRTFHVT